MASLKLEEKLVKNFLSMVEVRDLPAASAMIAPTAQLVFPGGKKFGNLEQMVEASTARYKRIGKIIKDIESIEDDEGMTVVYVRGTLEGINNLGVPFSGIRFVDRFVVHDGLIRSQEVWNDLAESGVLSRQS